MQRLDLPERSQLAFAAAVELLDLIDGGLMGSKAIAPVDEHDRLGNALEIHRPVEGRIAATHQQHPLVLELFGVDHLEEESLLLVAVLSFDPQLPCLEGPDARGDYDGLRGIVVIRGFQHEVAAVTVLDLAESRHHLAQVGCGAKLESLGRHVAHQILGQHLGEAGDVEDVFLGIERHELATERRKRVDDPSGCAAHSRVERGEEAGRSTTR